MTIIGKIVEVRDSEKKISRSYTYGYRSLRILAGNEYYSVLVNTQKLNQYGFLPKVGQWIRVTGRVSSSYNEMYDKSIDWVKELEHIEPPKPIDSQKEITIEKILNVLKKEWQNLEDIFLKLGVNKKTDMQFVKNKLKELKRKRIIRLNNFNGKMCWKLR